MAANGKALAGYWLPIAYAFDQAVAYNGVLMLAYCKHTSVKDQDPRQRLISWLLGKQLSS
jgi:hypothetical protein